MARAGRSRPAGGGSAADVRTVLDAFRRIVQALRLGRPDDRRGRAASAAQWFALQRIAEHPGASVNEIAALTFTHQSSVSVVIQRLAAQGLVRKMPSPHDRRLHRLEVTAAGRRVLQGRLLPVQDRLIAAVADLPAADRRVLAESLTTLARSVTPEGAAPQPPMFFEESPRRGRKARIAG